jgi:hypothetical protein
MVPCNVRQKPFRVPQFKAETDPGLFKVIFELDSRSRIQLHKQNARPVNRHIKARMHFLQGTLRLLLKFRAYMSARFLYWKNSSRHAFSATHPGRDKSAVFKIRRPEKSPKLVRPI